MALAFEAISKNSFINFVVKSPDVEDRQPPRSRSADSARKRPGVMEIEKLAQQSLQSLTSILNGGASETTPPALSPATPVCKASNPPVPDSQKSCSDSPQTPLDKCSDVNSSCSSTVATDDTSSEHGESTINRMKAVWSSGSICSMVSDRCGSVAEDGAEATGENPSPTCIRGANQPKVVPQMRHHEVPKNHNMAEMYRASKWQPPTTLMIRNVPGKYTQEDLMQDLMETGFGGTYNFLYLPMDKGTGASVGYAFVNFVDPITAANCMKWFEGHRFLHQQRSSKKLAKISVAHLQGLEKNLQHYKNTIVNASTAESRRPVVIANVSSVSEYVDHSWLMQAPYGGEQQ